MNNLKYKISYYLLPQNSIKLLSMACFILGLLCIPFSLSIVLFSTDSLQNMLMGLFVGLWSPTLIGIGNYLKCN
jgi:hypothetical protein